MRKWIAKVFDSYANTQIPIRAPSDNVKQTWNALI